MMHTTGHPVSQYEMYLLYALVLMFISMTVSNLRHSVGRKWESVLFLIFYYLICMVIAIGLSVTSHDLDNSVHERKAGIAMCEISKDWRKELSLDKKNKQSQQVARYAFIYGGHVRSYIDLNGNLREYQPSNEDRQAQLLWLTDIKSDEQIVRFYFWSGIIWLFIPVLGISLGFTGISGYIKKLGKLRLTVK